jgi:hypothetical protein
MEDYRILVRLGPHAGNRRLTNMFGSFEGRFAIDPSIPGLDTTVRLQASASHSQVKGSARTIRYLQIMSQDPRFTVTGVNRPRVTPIGKTDADLTFRHNETGLKGRIEVKDMSADSQRRNLRDIKLQILKMGHDHRQMGEWQYWINRQGNIPEVKEFARQHGVLIYERLGTGSFRPGTESFQKFLNEQDQRFLAQARMQVVSGGVQAGLGAFLFWTGSAAALQDVRELLEQDRARRDSWLRLGEHGSLVMSGAGLTVGGMARVGQSFSSLQGSSRMMMAGKWGGRAGVAGFVAAEGFVLWQYASGTMSDRQFVANQATLGGGIVGSLSGAWAGAKGGAGAGALIGSFFGPPGTAVGASIGGTIGAIGGGLAGGYVGATMGLNQASRSYHLHDQEQEERLAEFLHDLFARE